MHRKLGFCLLSLSAAAFFGAHAGATTINISTTEGVAQNSVYSTWNTTNYIVSGSASDLGLPSYISNKTYPSSSYPSGVTAGIFDFSAPSGDLQGTTSDPQSTLALGTKGGPLDVSVAGSGVNALLFQFGTASGAGSLTLTLTLADGSTTAFTSAGASPSMPSSGLFGLSAPEMITSFVLTGTSPPV